MIDKRQDMSSTIREFYGASTEAKPTTCGAGSTYFEWDTSKVFMFDGTNWREL